ncbi:hypothetical protein ACWD7C_06475 [Streptomyces sp. NPDC005134]|uniref:hypothetical protein n=1 Tax=Streptomyces sp. NPDC005098 TaxID=3154560 RepID=UPI0033ADB0B2
MAPQRRRSPLAPLQCGGVSELLITSLHDHAHAEAPYLLAGGVKTMEGEDKAFIEVEYNRTRLRKHPVYGFVTPLETRTLTTRGLAPAA